MVSINFNLSGSTFYKFTDPIRKYKANDPYYYEVDNIPIEQLEENILWIKDAIESATVSVDGADPLSNQASRSNFVELQPYVSGVNSNIVSVKPGRFIARINDAYDLTPLQLILRVFGNELAVGEWNEWTVATVDNILLKGILERFQKYLANSALGMNGLAERSFGSYLMRTPETIGATETNGFDPLFAAFNNVGTDFNVPVFLWGGSPIGESNYSGTATPQPSIKVNQYTASGNGFNQGFFSLLYTDTQFIKKWRGIARTAVVDVADPLSIAIDPFDPDDYSYIDDLDGLVNSESPNSSPSLVTQRIDLLFIYSKPIDTSAVHLNYGWAGSTPRKIYKPELGIVKGAGLKLNYTEGQNINSAFIAATPRQAILGNPSDELNTNLGFKSLGVRGSFPAPDDLMNIAPVLAEWLPNNHYSLVGQSILPVAYIVVRKNTLNENEDQIITASDVIDIRPFFRTTELTYGERAGIAAAMPSISLANPVATEGLVVYESNRLKTYVNSKIDQLRTQLTSTSNDPPATGGGGGGGSQPPTSQPNTFDYGMGRVLTRGIIRGGSYFGPEGAICRAIKAQYNNISDTETVQKFRTLHNLPPEYTLTNFPDWDLASWVLALNTNVNPPAGLGITDRINYWAPGWLSQNQYPYGHNDEATNNNSTTFGPFRKITANNAASPESGYLNRLLVPRTDGRIYGTKNGGFWVSKTISLDITNTSWVEDISVVANYWNSAPYGYSQTFNSLSHGIMVSKGAKRENVPGPNGSSTRNYIDFTIFVFFPESGYIDDNYTPSNHRAEIIDSPAPTGNALNTIAGMRMTQFVANSHCLLWKENGDPWINGGTSLPRIIYPSVEFTIIGHPRVYSGTQSQFFNDIHKVPGINSHEGSVTTSRTDRPLINLVNRPS